MKLNQPYYIEPRRGENHLDLGGVWDFFGSEQVLEADALADDKRWRYQTTLPRSVFHSLHEAGVLPDPYVGTNSKLYADVDEKIWYYRKKFTLDRPDFDGNAYLCFDGVAYYCRVWVNGVLLGDHEGMFAGPVCDIAPQLRLCGENEILVEVKACNYGIKDTFDPDNRQGNNTQIVPWNLARDNHTSSGDFIVLGIWNTVRLELVNKTHISRPYLYTRRIEDHKAELFLELEIADGTIPELVPYYGYHDHCYSYTRAYDNGLTGAVKNECVELQIEIFEPETGIPVYKSVESVPLTDFEKLGMNPDYYELQYFSKVIELDEPRLWYPVGLGEPYLYRTRLTLCRDGAVCDVQEFDTGVRTVTARRTSGKKYRARWGDFRFSVNGKDFFLMGINWMPIDYLYSVDPREYEWCLMLAKNAGIQMLRVWSGGGMPESDVFYSLCDRLGIMVWQDHLLANTADTHAYAQDILESQEAYNLYRMRNHASLALHCGGNEFNPYSVGNAASMFVIDRVIRTLDPARIFHYTTADRGSAHIYRDMEPVWYRHRYAELPFLAESGIHSFPSYRSLRKLLSEKECTGILPDLSAPEFAENFPELLGHFTEYAPSRVPRMLSRASQIADMNGITLEGMCEATQAQAYEFYTLMIQAMRENYPFCGGVLPWVFKRHWTTVGIQVVDGSGQPGYPYYAVQNTYRPLGVCLSLEWSVIAPGERVPLKVRLFNQNGESTYGDVLSVTVYAPDMTPADVQTHVLRGCENEYTFADFVPDAAYTDTCFLIAADWKRAAEIRARTVYFVKCTSLLADPALYAKYRSEPSENLYFKNGPWLKAGLCAAKRATLTAEFVATSTENGRTSVDIRVRNVSDIAAYPVTVEPVNTNVRFFANENFFLLAPGEIKNLRIVCDGLGKDAAADMCVKAWNSAPCRVVAKGSAL